MRRIRLAVAALDDKSGQILTVCRKITQTGRQQNATFAPCYRPRPNCSGRSSRRGCRPGNSTRLYRLWSRGWRRGGPISAPTIPDTLSSMRARALPWTLPGSQHPDYTHRGSGDRSRRTEHFFLASRLWQPRMGLLSFNSLTSRRVK
jgi:hypothetical protein